jgi:O-antigen/teichoic acid export membrane protein
MAFTPYIVHGFGEEAYGALAIVLGIVGYLSFLDLNLGQAALKYVAEFRGEGSLAKINDVAGTIIFLFLGIGIIGGLALLLSVDTISTRFLKIRPDLVQTTRSALYIGAVGFPAILILSAATGIVNGLNRFDITGKMTIGSSILIAVGTVSLIKFGYGIEWVVALNVGASLLGFGVLIRTAKRVMPGLKCKPVFRGKMAGVVLGFASYTVLGRFAFVMTFECDKLLAGVLLGSSYVTFYSVPAMLAKRIMDAITRCAYVTYPMFSELQGRKALEQVTDLYLNASRIVFVLATSIALPLLIFGNKFLVAWMGHEFAGNAGMVMQLSTVALYLVAATQVPSLLLNGLGFVKITGLFALLGAGLSLALIYPLTSIMGMGVDGIAASFLISRIVSVPAFLIVANRKIIGLSIVKLLREVYVRPVILGALVWAVVCVLPIYRVHNIFLTIGAMALTSMLYIASAMIVGLFTNTERQAVITYVRKLSNTA